MVQENECPPRDLIYEAGKVAVYAYVCVCVCVKL